jgi:hypothetical protein
MTEHRPFFIPYTPRPEHDAARHLRDFETQEQAEKELTRVAHILETAGATAAANALRTCRTDQPCGCAHCPVCGRHFRRWFIAAAMRLIEDVQQ